MRYFSRIRPQPGRTADPGVWRATADAYRLKQSIWGLFPHEPDHERDFLFRFDQGSNGPLVYLLSDREPYDHTGLWRIETKAYQPVLKHGDRLFFNLRANPVVTKKREDGRRVRHDVVMEAKHANKSENSNAPPVQAELVSRAGIKWLLERTGKYGFTIEPANLHADNYTQHDLKKTNNGHPIHLSTIDFEGLLTVTTPDCFLDMLYTGIGPAKAFGCGLMLIRRA